MINSVRTLHTTCECCPFLPQFQLCPSQRRQVGGWGSRTITSLLCTCEGRGKVSWCAPRYTIHYDSIMECKEHHHLTEQLDLISSAPLSVSPGPPEVLLGTIGGWGQGGGGSEMHRCIQMCVCACTYTRKRKRSTILHVPCTCHVTSCETHPATTLSPHPIMHLSVGVWGGRRDTDDEIPTLIIHACNRDST